MDCVSVLPSKPGLAWARISPTVVAEVLDHYTRRSPGQERVIGTLLGTVRWTRRWGGAAAGGHAEVDVCGSFAVPHVEDADEVALDVEYHQRMLSLVRSAGAPGLEVVGWYCTGWVDHNNSAVIHEFYAHECGVGVDSVACLLVEPGVSGDAEGGDGGTVRDPLVGVYTGVVSQLGGQSMSTDLTPVGHEVVPSSGERIVLDVLTKVLGSGAAAGEGDGSGPGRLQPPSALNELASLERSLRRLLDALDSVLEYVGDVISGDEIGDPQVGRLLLETCAAIPHLCGEAYDQSFQSSVKDYLVVLYLSKLTSANLVLSERLLTLGA
ncbi:hypothetical protein CDCA_CDCA07G2040 [Cyanidium caldarium]|uniref:MPN domain-containing protein n=1 Tax=Cyanidium caldarium TaxID=2771 RepID=A0AAV9IUN5_CYACA|nr:hypothetical protein CDCA_CDCA07G2040 [Cyanidium caldarium]|eukprot:ctg_824.g278